MTPYLVLEVSLNISTSTVNDLVIASLCRLQCYAHSILEVDGWCNISTYVGFHNCLIDKFHGSYSVRKSMAVQNRKGKHVIDVL